ncbi:hypothetical protein CTM46_07330 [Prevotella intermedia]|uniref:Uncharacterized protein n=1 Tax=Prevotella intermedia TaxID=28131 RepID=A0A2D3LKX3_PREIN|nr:hypothetical protein CTM46_07330 [Prevotella intermedia]
MVNIIPKKNDSFDLTLRKRRFCDAKEPLLPCKTYAFRMQNNRFCNMLIHNMLHDTFFAKNIYTFVPNSRMFNVSSI